MLQSVSGVYCNYVVEREQQMENAEDVYESVDGIQSQKPETEEDCNFKRKQETLHKGGDTVRSRFYKIAALCLVLLCLLLLAAITVQWIKFPADYANLSKERDQLQKQIENLTIESDRLKRDMDALQKSLLQLGWGFFNSSIYYISTEMKTWDEGREECQKRGADLVIINSKEEQEFISTRFNNTEAWIGLSDAATEGDFKWVDGKGVSIKFWSTGEPNDYGRNEDCVITSYKTATNISSWSDFPCDHIGRAVAMCERVVN